MTLYSITIYNFNQKKKIVKYDQFEISSIENERLVQEYIPVIPLSELNKINIDFYFGEMSVYFLNYNLYHRFNNEIEKTFKLFEVKN